MKRTWSKFEKQVTYLTLAIIPMAAWLAAELFRGVNAAMASFAALVLIPLLCTAALARFHKKRGNRVWPASVVLALSSALLCVALKYNAELAGLVHRITGYHNLELVVVVSLFILLVCSGALIGTGIGFLLPGVAGSKMEAA